MTRLGVRGVLAGTALALVSVPFALLLVLVRVEWAPLRRLDVDLALFFNGVLRDRPGLTAAVQLLTDVGSPTVWRLVTLVVALVLLARRRRADALFLVVTSAGSAALVTGVKLVVDRARPVLEDPVSAAAGASFPSGHATGALACALALLLVLSPALSRRARPWVAAVVVVLALAVGATRVVLGVHYLTDVLAGFLLATAWVAAVAAAFSSSLWPRGVGAPPPDPAEEPELAVRR